MKVQGAVSGDMGSQWDGHRSDICTGTWRISKIFSSQRRLGKNILGRDGRSKKPRNVQAKPRLGDVSALLPGDSPSWRGLPLSFCGPNPSSPFQFAFLQRIPIAALLKPNSLPSFLEEVPAAVCDV